MKTGDEEKRREITLLISHYPSIMPDVSCTYLFGDALKESMVFSLFHLGEWPFEILHSGAMLVIPYRSDELNFSSIFCVFVKKNLTFNSHETINITFWKCWPNSNDSSSH